MTRTILLALALAIPASSALGAPGSRALPTADLQARSLSLLEDRFLAAEDPDSDLRVTRMHQDELQLSHTRVQQTFGGIPVFQGEAIVHLRRDGSVFAVTDHLVRGLDLDVEPRISASDAADLAVLADGGGDEYTAAPQIDLQILTRGEPRLTWRVQLHRLDGTEETAMPVFFIDAHTGEVAFQYDNLQTATGTGASIYSGSVSIETYYRSGTYYMEDMTRKLGTFDMRNSSFFTYRFADSNNIWDSSSQRAGVDAHYGSRKVYEYFKNVHGRTGIDGKGGPVYYAAADGATGLISSRVHYGYRYNNAFWDGSRMNYGDGDGQTFGSLVTLDITGHEMTHGVTQFTAGLTYQGESGALNESMSDVFGTMVEFYARGAAGNWKIGEEAYTPGTSGDALRDMSDPHKDPNYNYTSDDDPDHYAERYTGTGDSGGVHINSGIPNKVFYLLSEGGTHHRGGSMTGIGKSAAEKIWYKALTSFMTSGTNFSQGRAATLNAASALYGASSSQYAAVARAWELCGVL